jgi:hypothetical protein
VNLIDTLKAAGFKGEALRKAWAVAMRESGGRAEAFNGNAKTGDKSYGLFQINMLGSLGPQRMKALGLSSENDLLDPLVNAKAAYHMTNGGKNWQSWDIDSSGYNGGTHAAAFQKWYKQYPGDSGGGADVAGKKAKTTASGAVAPDTLNRAQLAAKYGYALKVIYSNPELTKIFETAFGSGKGGQMDPTGFAAAVENSKWYQENNSFARTAWTAEMLGGADWSAQQETARSQVQAQAAKLGAKLTPEQLDSMTHRYLYEGWAAAGRSNLMDAALSESITGDAAGTLAGAAGNLQGNLASIAQANGVKLSAGYYSAAAKSVDSSLSTEQDWERDIRTQAASKWPTWSDKIMAGANVKDLASGYIQTMSQVFEIDPNTISLDDPYLRSAMTAVDEKGAPRQVGLWDFETKLRQDPRWMKTKQATDSVANIATDVLKKFGFMT